MLKVEHLSAGYGDLKVLYDVSLEVANGEIVSLIGSNGAGKTTLLRVISGFLHASAGTVTFDDVDLLKKQPYERPTLGIAHIPQGRGILGKLTVRENLELGAYGKQVRKHLKQNMEHAFSMFPKLFERQKQIAGSLSGGEQQMLSIARSLMMEPKIIMMDEPSLGLAPIVVEEVFQIIETVAKEGMSILVVEQNLIQALSVAKRGYVLENGRLVKEGLAKDLLDDDEVRAAYLGV